jgi:hypothetical protein
MRQGLYRELEEMERIEAAARQARAGRDRLCGVEMLRQLLSRHGIGQLPGESLAETVARAAGISAWELRDLLWKSAQAISP